MLKVLFALLSIAIASCGGNFIGQTASCSCLVYSPENGGVLLGAYDVDVCTVKTNAKELATENCEEDRAKHITSVSFDCDCACLQGEDRCDPDASTISG